MKSKLKSEAISQNSEYLSFIAELKEKLNIIPWKDWRSNSEQNKKDRIGVSWSMGGTSGSCWDDTIITVSGDTEPNFIEIDLILDYYCPDISYVKYKIMHNKLINNDQGREGDYYGGCITYGYKYIYLEELFNWLKENKFFPKQPVKS